MKNYNEILRKVCDGSQVTDEEWEWIVARVTRKLRDKQELTNQEISCVLLPYYDTCADIIYLRHHKDTYWEVNYILQVANDEFYSIHGILSPEYWWGDIPDQHCPRVDQREVLVKKWVCI